VKIYKNRTITKEPIVLEEVCLIDCILTDCDVFYSGGDADYQNLGNYILNALDIRAGVIYIG
jgi:hypothetical protein